MAQATENSGTRIVKAARDDATEFLMPNKILQHVKRYVRCEARKPVDMGVKTYFMHLNRINLEEIPRLPPNFNTAQSLGADELVNILLFGIPKS